MTSTQRDATRESCERNGIHWARSVVGTRSDGEVAQQMREWIDEYEAREKAAIELRQYELTRRSTEATEMASSAAADSAKTSGTSARAAMFAAAVSFLALIVSVAAYFKQG